MCNAKFQHWRHHGRQKGRTLPEGQFVERFVGRTLTLLCFAGVMLGVAAPTATAGVLPKDSAEQYELTFWESIKNSNHAGDYEAYLQAFPKGRFAVLARARIDRLRGATPKARLPEAAESGTPALDSAPAAGTATGAGKNLARRRTARSGKTANNVDSAAPPAASASKPAAAASSASSAMAAGTAAVSGGTSASGPEPTLITEVADCKTCPVLISLPAGEFTMGSDASDPTERPAFRVTIGQPFAIGKYEVTVAQWNACTDAGACPRVTNDSSRAADGPARDVSWDDAQIYLKWLSKSSGKPYRLPTEAEWEFAARGGTTTRYWWGQQMATGKASCKECGEPWRAEAPVKVGSFERNPFGLYDMNGSVWEWVSDCWHSSFQRAPSDGQSWEEPDCRVRVLRGGSWREGALYMPSSTRFKYDASLRESQNGFRVARNLQ